MVDKKPAFLAALAETGNITEAARCVGMHRCGHYEWLKDDPEYAAAAAAALEEAADKLELEARRRALEGYDRPVFQRGEEVGVVREYSDALMQFLLKGIRPEKYRERIDHRVDDTKVDPESKKLRKAMLADPELRRRIDRAIADGAADHVA